MEQRIDRTADIATTPINRFYHFAWMLTNGGARFLKLTNHRYVRIERSNSAYWAPEKPPWMLEYHTQFPQRVNIWVGVVGDRILGSYFID